MKKRPSGASEPTLEDLLAAALPPPTPNYDKAVEITIGDFAKRQNWGWKRAADWLEAEVAAGRWLVRVVKEGKHTPRAYRPRAK